MEAIVEKLEDTKLRRIDIGSWSSAVAKQHGIRSLPSLWLYDGRELVSKDARDVLTRLVRRANG